MKPIKVTTVEQARALREVSHPYLDHRDEVDPKTGITTRYMVSVPFSPAPIDGDQILLFIDSDGRSMQVAYRADGPVKARFSL